MKISVRFFTVLREMTGKKEELFQFTESEKVTLDKVLEKLRIRYGKSFVDYVYDPQTGEPKKFLQFLINGQNSLALKGLQSELCDGDVLAIIPPVGGG